MSARCGGSEDAQLETGAVMRYVTPDEFAGYEKVAYTKGFLMVSASPLTRACMSAPS